MTHRLLVKLNQDIKDKNFNIERFFKLEDDDGKGSVPFYVFRDCIDKINPGIKKSEFLELDNSYKMMIQNKEHYNYVKFIQDISYLNIYDKIMAKLFDKIVEQMKIGKPDIFKLFENYDENGKDLVDANDMVSCFKQISLMLSSE